jgi:hypothetical protein
MEVFLTNKVDYVALLKYLYRNKRKDSRLYQKKTYVYILNDQMIDHNNNQIIFFMSIKKLTMIME